MPRQAQKKPNGKIAEAKPTCPNHEHPVMMYRIYLRGKKGYIPCGWRCKVEGCNNTILD